jgi:hypothetical protein
MTRHAMTPRRAVPPIGGQSRNVDLLRGPKPGEAIRCGGCRWRKERAMCREERPGALAPGPLAGTSRRGIPAWVPQGSCQEIHAMLRRPSVRFQVGRPIAPCRAGKGCR